MASKLNTTPAGIAVYPHLDSPDTKYDDNGVYTSKLRFEQDASGVEELIQFLQDEMEVSLAEATEKWKVAVAEEKDARKKRKLKAKPPEAADTPWDIDEEENTVEVNFKMKASGKSRKTGKAWSRRPKLYDAQLEVVPFGVRVGGGSVLKVGFNVSRFWTALVGAGIALQLEAVQILELKIFQSVTAEEAGFEKIADGGFSAADLTAEDSAVPATPEGPVAGESEEPEDAADAGAKDADHSLSDF